MFRTIFVGSFKGWCFWLLSKQQSQTTSLEVIPIMTCSLTFYQTLCMTCSLPYMLTWYQTFSLTYCCTSNNISYFVWHGAELSLTYRVAWYITHSSDTWSGIFSDIYQAFSYLISSKSRAQRESAEPGRRRVWRRLWRQTSRDHGTIGLPVPMGWRPQM